MAGLLIYLSLRARACRKYAGSMFSAGYGLVQDLNIHFFSGGMVFLGAMIGLTSDRDFMAGIFVLGCDRPAQEFVHLPDSSFRQGFSVLYFTLTSSHFPDL